jgi:hypothetical protein
VLPSIHSVNVRLSIWASTILRILMTTNPWTLRRPLAFSLAHRFRDALLGDGPHLRCPLRSPVQYHALDFVVPPVLGYFRLADTAAQRLAAQRSTTPTRPDQGGGGVACERLYGGAGRRSPRIPRVGLYLLRQGATGYGIASADRGTAATRSSNASDGSGRIAACRSKPSERLWTANCRLSRLAFRRQLLILLRSLGSRAN